METHKKGFKMPNSFTILFILTFIVAILTWIIPAGQYDLNEDKQFIAGTYQMIERTPQGIWDFFAAPIYGMIGKEGTDGAISVSLFILVVGGFLGVVTETGAINAGIATLIRKNRERVNLLIWGLMFLFALGGSTYGMAEETIAFYPLLIPVMVTVGMDALVAVGVVLIGSGLGVLASTVNPFATGPASAMAGISMADGIFLRVIFFFAMYIVGAYYVSRYAKRVQENPKNSYIHHLMEAHRAKFKVDESVEELNKKQRIVLILFATTFVVMILGLIPWAKLFNVETCVFDDIHAALLSIPFVGDFIGKSSLALGQWYLTEITMLFFAMSIVIAFVYRIKEDRFVTVFLDGMRDLLSVAMICAVARGLQVVMNDGHITATILHYGEVGLKGLSNGIFIVLTYLFYIPMSFLIPSTSGLAAATMGIMAPLGDFAGVSKSLVITAYQASCGVVNLLTPTSGVVMGALAIAGVELTTWWKFMKKLVVVVVVISIALLVLGAIAHL